METVSCDLCGSCRAREVLRQGDLLHEISREIFTVVRCMDCGLGYLNPRPTAEEIGRYYPDQYFAPAEPGRKTGIEKSVKRFSRRVKRWIMEDFYGYPGAGRGSAWRILRKGILWPEQLRRRWVGRDLMPWIGGGRLLDVGCGPGGNLKVFQDQGWDVYGVEFSQAAAAQARARVGDRIHEGELETAPYEDETFDVIFLSHSLEHFLSPSRALMRIHRLLAPQGRLVIAVPNADSLEARLFGAAWVPWDPPRHLYHFTPATLRRLLEKCAFRAIRLRTGVGSHFFMVSLERQWRLRFGRPLPFKRLIEKLIARPFCLVAGHLGYGTELKVYAIKYETAVSDQQPAFSPPDPTSPVTRSDR
jgi:SAM-dependent methyltransferase